MHKIGIHSLKLQITPLEPNKEWVLEELTLTNLFWSSRLDKIAYIISPTIWANFTDRKVTLENHGFTVKHFKSPNEYESIFTQLDEEEDRNSIIFLLIGGHGNYIPQADNGTGDSYITINPDTVLKIYSSELRNQITILESKRILIMAESCYSGGFKDDLQIDGVSIMTAADTEHASNTNFGYYFFEGVRNLNMDDMDAFDYTCQFFDGYYNPVVNPLAYWGSWHSFFAP